HVSAPRPPLRAGGRRSAMRAVLVLIAALVAFIAVGGLGTLAVGLGASRVVTDSHELPTGLRTLTIDTGDVPMGVRLITDADADRPRVHLRVLTRAADTRLTIANDASGSRVALGGSGSGFPFSIGADTREIKVILPPDVARELRVTVTHRTGSITSEADVDQLIAKTDTGTVTLSGSARLIDITVRNGDIKTGTRIAVTESFRAITQSGRISVEFRAVPRITEAIGSGQVTLGLPGPAPYRISAESAGPHGNVVVTVPQTTDLNAAEVTARSTSGNVVITQNR
ncbi:DUF4097 domain-containing protein, partial [Mycobacterium sp. 852002-51152_SCH6134967]|uniref:DUF4097 domain-containing protein n=1 Tax=Mycobacterium sp. 852002-51152_SCH6134967 TaxID=1834096 RepID=UPI000AD8ED9A